MTEVELMVISGLSRKLSLSSTDEVLISPSETAPAVPSNPVGTMVRTIRIASNTLRIRLLLAINIPPKILFYTKRRIFHTYICYHYTVISAKSQPY